MKLYMIAIVGNSDTVDGFRILDYDSKEVSDFKYGQVYNVLKKMPNSIYNVKIKDGKIVGSNGDFSRYARILSNNKCLNANAMVVLAQFGDIGFVVCNYKGNVITVKESEIVSYVDSKRVTIANGRVIHRNGSNFIAAISGEYPRIEYTPKVASKDKVESEHKVEPVTTVTPKKTPDELIRSNAENNKSIELFSLLSKQQISLLKEYYSSSLLSGLSRGELNLDIEKLMNNIKQGKNDNIGLLADIVNNTFNLDTLSTLFGADIALYLAKFREAKLRYPDTLVKLSKEKIGSIRNAIVYLAFASKPEIRKKISTSYENTYNNVKEYYNKVEENIGIGRKNRDKINSLVSGNNSMITKACIAYIQYMFNSRYFGDAYDSESPFLDRIKDYLGNVKFNYDTLLSVIVYLFNRLGKNDLLNTDEVLAHNFMDKAKDIKNKDLMIFIIDSALCGEKEDSVFHSCKGIGEIENYNIAEISYVYENTERSKIRDIYLQYGLIEKRNENTYNNVKEYHKELEENTIGKIDDTIDEDTETTVGAEVIEDNDSTVSAQSDVFNREPAQLNINNASNDTDEKEVKSKKKASKPKTKDKTTDASMDEIKKAVEEGKPLDNYDRLKLYKVLRRMVKIPNNNVTKVAEDLVERKVKSSDISSRQRYRINEAIDLLLEVREKGFTDEIKGRLKITPKSNIKKLLSNNPSVKSKIDTILATQGTNKESIVEGVVHNIINICKTVESTGNFTQKQLFCIEKAYKALTD